MKGDSESESVRCRRGDDGVDGDKVAAPAATDAALTSLAILLRLDVDELRLPPGPVKNHNNELSQNSLVVDNTQNN